VTAARDDQKEAQQQFKDALTRLKEITKFDGGKLESAYNSLKGEYDDCAAKAESVHTRIKDVESVAADLFKEWEKENAEISTASLRESSRAQLAATRKRYDELHLALKNAEQSMTPVLTQFHDYVPRFETQTSMPSHRFIENRDFEHPGRNHPPDRPDEPLHRPHG